jgi:hypothetical protein
MLRNWWRKGSQTEALKVRCSGRKQAFHPMRSDDHFSLSLSFSFSHTHRERERERERERANNPVNGPRTI